MPAHNPIQLDDRKRKPVRVGDRVRITIGRDKGRTGVYEDCVPRVGLWTHAHGSCAAPCGAPSPRHASTHPHTRERERARSCLCAHPGT